METKGVNNWGTFIHHHLCLSPSPYSCTPQICTCDLSLFTDISLNLKAVSVNLFLTHCTDTPLHKYANLRILYHYHYQTFDNISNNQQAYNIGKYATQSSEEDFSASAQLCILGLRWKKTTIAKVGLHSLKTSSLNVSFNSFSCTMHIKRILDTKHAIDCRKALFLTR